MDRKSLLYKVLKKCEKPGCSKFWRFMNCIFSEVMIGLGLINYLYYHTIYKNRELIFIPTTDAGDLLFLRYSYDFIMKSYGKDTVLLFDNRNKKVVQALGFENICPVSQMSIVTLAKAYYCYGNTIIKHIHNVYCWCFFDMVCTTDKYEKSYPKYFPKSNNINKIFADNELKPYKTVILAPYEQAISATGLNVIPIFVWEKLAITLQAKGYSVCTNCKGDERERPVGNTKRIFPLFDELEEAANKAGYYISIRSGFCDFTANSNAKKIIFYPDNKYYQQFSLLNFGYNGEVKEIIYADSVNSNKWDNIIEEIVKFIEEQDKDEL